MPSISTEHNLAYQVEWWRNRCVVRMEVHRNFKVHSDTKNKALDEFQTPKNAAVSSLHVKPLVLGGVFLLLERLGVHRAEPLVVGELPVRLGVCQRLVLPQRLLAITRRAKRGAGRRA